MKLLFGRLLKDVAIYGTGDIILRATGFVTMPIYTRIFTPEDYGVWSFVSTVVGLLSGILILGGDSAYARFFFEAKTLQERQLVTSTWFGFLALWSGGVVLLCVPLTSLFSRWSFGTNQHGILFILALLAAPISLINTMCGQVLRNQFRASLFIVLNILSTVLIIGFSVCAVVILRLGLAGLLGGTLLGVTIVLPVRLWTARTMLRLVFSASLLRNLLAFGVPLVPTSLAYWIFASSDRIVLGKLSTLNELGLYSIANGVASILGLIKGAFGQAWSPYAFRMYEEQREAAPAFFGQVTSYILIGFGLLCVAITTFARELLTILTTPAFYPAALAIGPLSLGFVAYASTQVTTSGISLKKKTKYIAIYSWIAALLNLGLNILFVPRWGMVAASWTTAVSYIFLTVAYAFRSQQLWPICYEKSRIFRASGLIFAFTVAVPFLPELKLIPSIIMKSIYCLFFIGLLFGLGILGRREWIALSSVIRRKVVLAGTVK